MKIIAIIFVVVAFTTMTVFSMLTQTVNKIDIGEVKEVKMIPGNFWDKPITKITTEETVVLLVEHQSVPVGQQAYVVEYSSLILKVFGFGKGFLHDGSDEIYFLK